MQQGRESAYLERLSVPLRWWALAVMFWATVLLAFLIAMPTLPAVAVSATLLAATAAFFLTYGRAEVEVEVDGDDGSLRAGRARIPLSLLGSAEPLDEEATRLLVGREADARAYLLLRPYVPQAVKVRLEDPRDPTPYWVISTRHPGALASCLNDGRAGRLGVADSPT